MIKYVELTAPESSEFRQVKILSMKVSEGDSVCIGDPLFIVQSGKNKIELPSTKEGRVTEIIALVGENISLMTPLVLLETEVTGSTATPPIVDEQDLSTAATSEQNKVTPTSEESIETETTEKVEPVNEKPSKKPEPVRKKAKKKSNKKSTEKAKPIEKADNTSKNPGKKNHQQQSLDLGGDGESHQFNIKETSTSVPTPAKPTEQSDTPDHNMKPKTSESEEHKPVSNTMKTSIVTIPDIGTDSAKVIDILVKVGDTVSVEDPLITLESDKASMDVPSPYSGTIESIAIELDQDITEGIEVLAITTSEDSAPISDDIEPITESDIDNPAPNTDEVSATSIVDVTVPDIGGDPAKVIEILVKVGQEVQQEDSLITLESDKASMEVPSPASGIVVSIDVQLDDEVNEGHLIVTLESASSTQSSVESTTNQAASHTEAPKSALAPTPIAASSVVADLPTSNSGKAHASPSIRRFARELGVDLTRVVGSGRKGRITRIDVNGFVKSIMSGAAGSASTQNTGGGIPEVPAIDFTKFGEIDIQPLNRIKRLTATFLHRSWLNIPHVTHSDESNISELETFRKQLNAEYVAQDKKIKLSPLAFIVKAVVNGLQTYPQFNSSLEPGGENLIYKKYIHIGIAVETPNGLVVPVIRDADKKTVADIAVEMGELAKKARDKKLKPADMSGACFTISSLGGIGGTHFTPIVNAPEVAILGVSRSKMAPIWNGEEFTPAMMLPLNLSYDHRVIDGAEAARFTRHLAAILEDVRRLTI